MRQGRKQKSIARAIIDMTPLLDVIFLLLIVILSSYSENSKQALELQEEYTVLVENNSMLDSQSELVNVCTVYATFDPKNVRMRELHYAFNQEEVRVISLKPNNEESAWQECEQVIRDFLKEHENKPLIVSLRNEKMLYRDEKRFLQMFESLSEESDIYLKNQMEETYE